MLFFVDLFKESVLQSPANQKLHTNAILKSIFITKNQQFKVYSFVAGYRYMGIIRPILKVTHTTG